MGCLRKVLSDSRLQKQRKLINKMRSSLRGNVTQKNTATKINFVWSRRKDPTQSVTLLHYRQQKQRKAKKTWMDEDR